MIDIINIYSTPSTVRWRLTHLFWIGVQYFYRIGTSTLLAIFNNCWICWGISHVPLVKIPTENVIPMFFARVVPMTVAW